MLVYYLQTIESEDDRSKFERIYYRYRKLMFHVALKILHNDQDAEDAVHQAFVSIIENISRVREPSLPETRCYIVTITERKAIDILRSREKLISMDYDETVKGIEIPPPETSALADAMAKLPARYREVLLLRYRNGYSNAELGKILNIKAESVQRLVLRAKESLRDILVKGEDFS